MQKKYAAGPRKDNQSKQKLKGKQPAKAMKQKNSLFVHWEEHAVYSWTNNFDLGSWVCILNHTTWVCELNHQARPFQEISRYHKSL